MMGHGTGDANHDGETRPLTPAEWRKEIDGTLTPAVAAAIRRINDALRKAVTSDRPVIVDGSATLHRGAPASYEVAEKAIGAFRAAGWVVNPTSNQHDGYFYTFTPPSAADGHR